MTEAVSIHGAAADHGNAYQSACEGPTLAPTFSSGRQSAELGATHENKARCEPSTNSPVEGSHLAHIG